MNIDIFSHLPIFTPINLILIIVTFLVIILALRIWQSDATNPINIFAASACAMGAIWLIGVLGSRNTDSPLLLSVFGRLAYVAQLFIPLFYFLFSYHFPYKTFILSQRYLLGLAVSTFFVLGILILPNVFLSWHVLAENRFKPEISVFWHIVFGVYYITLTGLSFYNLLTKYKHSHGIWRLRIKQVMTTTGVVNFGAPIGGVIVPIFLTINMNGLDHFLFYF